MVIQYKINDVYMKYCSIILDWTSISTTSSLMTNAFISSLSRNNGLLITLFTVLMNLYRMVIHYTIIWLLDTISFGLFRLSEWCNNIHIETSPISRKGSN